MAQPERIRHASVYRDGRKIATMTSNTFSGASGDESVIADEGYFGHTDGAETTKLSIDTIEPVRKGDAAIFKKAMRDKSYLRMSLALIGGEVEEVTMRCVSFEFTSETAAGKQTGKFEFEGGPGAATG